MYTTCSGTYTGLQYTFIFTSPLHFFFFFGFYFSYINIYMYILLSCMFFFSASAHKSVSFFLLLLLLLSFLALVSDGLILLLLLLVLLILLLLLGVESRFSRSGSSYSPLNTIHTHYTYTDSQSEYYIVCMWFGTSSFKRSKKKIINIRRSI